MRPIDQDAEACHLTASIRQETAAHTASYSAPATISGASVQKGFSAMNFRILAAPVRPRGRVSALLAATALSAAILVSPAQAQTPAPAPGPPAAAPKAKAAPKAAPKAPAA